MIGFALKRDEPAALARDRIDSGQRQSQALQHRALLDVEFQIGDGVAATIARRASSRGSRP